MSGFLSMGRETYKVPLSVFADNRKKLVHALQAAGLGDAIAVLEGGVSTTRYDSDHEPLFRQESYFWYLTGVKEPDCAVMIEVASGSTTLWVPQLPPEYATIMGKVRTCDEWRDLYEVDAVLYNSDLLKTLTSMLKKDLTTTNGGTNVCCPEVLLMKGPNSDSGKDYEPPPQLVKEFPDADTDSLFPILVECRVTKSAAELALLQHVTEVTSWAHAYVMRNVRPGQMEYQAESLFRHYCYYHYGCRLVGYTPICGCGPNAAVLHYGHAGEPNARQMSDGDMCLFDMGAEYCGYGSDVTCSFPIQGSFDDRQRAIYTAVLNAQMAVYDMIQPGVSWVDCHKAAEAELVKGLIQLGLVEPNGKSVEELVELRLGAVFMPHGLGHFIGIDTHDVGGYLPGHPPRSPSPGLKSLRTSRILQKDMTLTVEPGCYFIDHLLDSALDDTSPLKLFLVADKIAAFRGFGGVRLEDVVVVTDTGCINFTLCPRTIAEVEAVMAGAKWPPTQDEAPELRRVRLTNPNPLPSPAPPSV